MVSGYHLPFQQNDRRGLLVAVPPMATQSASAVKKARESSLQVKGARLFNLVLKDIRDMKGVTVDTFKAGWMPGCQLYLINPQYQGDRGLPSLTP